MMRSLFSGVAGLRNHQTRMDSVGNNISNVNTTGYKAGRVNFQDMLSQTLQGASAPQGNLGGTNPMQVGLGMNVASMDTQFTTGALQTTGVPTDLAISGDGFFVVSDGKTNSYTRDGSFKFDSNGNYIVPGTGLNVMGWMADSLGNINSSGAVQKIVKPSGVTMPAKASTSLTFAGNLNASTTNGGLAATSANVYDSLGTKHLVSQNYYKVNSGGANATDDGSNTWICKTNVEGATGVTNAFTQLSFNADGTLNTIKTLKPTTPATAGQTVGFTNFKLSTSSDPQTLAFSEFDSNSELRTFKMTFTYNSTASTWGCVVTEAGDVTNTALATISGIKWDAVTSNYTVPDNATPPVYSAFPGTLVPAINYKANDVAKTPNTVTITPFTAAMVSAPDATPIKGMASEPVVAANIVTELPLTFNIAGANAMSLTSNRSKITQSSDTTSTVTMTPDGYGMGSLTGVTFDSRGVMTGTFSNGQNKQLGQVAMAVFTNNNGLMKAGSNTYVESNNSGLAQIGEANSGGRGSLTPASLEMSNVDLSQEFSNMIITQRGFQANSKIITTSDTMLEELVNLKR